MNSLRFVFIVSIAIAAFCARDANAQIMKGVGNPEAITGTKPNVSNRTGPNADPPSKPNPTADDKKKAAAATKAVNAAIAELVKEYQEAKKGEGSTLRTKSDYFQGKPSPDVTPDAIIAALGRGAGAGPQATAYAKWQILSGLPGKFDDKFVNAALSAYKSAPQLSPRPGVLQPDKQKLDRAIIGKKETDVDAIQKQFAEEITKNEDLNQPILEYRNEMYSRLPTRQETFVAGFQDAFERVNSGLSPDGVFKPLVSDIGNWSVDSKTTAPQLRQMSLLLDNLQKQKKPKYYDQLTYNKDHHTVEWQTKDLGWPDEAALKNLSTDLLEKANNPGGLKFKDN